MRGIELTPEDPVSELVELGGQAEQAGFDTLFASSHYNNRDPFTVLSGIAAETDDIRLGPGVVNPYETHPITLASQVATIHEASNGRGICGLGAGDRSTLQNLGIDRDRPLRRVLETMKVSKRLWAGERVTHDGTFVAEDAGLNYAVGEIPVYIGAQGPHMLRMSAKHADGALVNASHPRDFSWADERISEGLSERPDHRGEFDFAAYASVSVAEDGDEAREAARPPVAFIAGGAAKPVLDRHGIDRERAEAIGKKIGAGKFTAAFETVTPKMIDAFCIAGTPATVADRIDAVLDYADSFVAGSPLGPDRSGAISLVAAALDRTYPER
ncbi:5,10-methylenetetrahydromethanopterin reductase [Haladaptatus sp. DFWS20]|uniref:5,10-methylenetetrahydromethanopterin reductase n=1 Tax=Haladaptatus sp. DFWS20 TaxID=3403467 RepID=UPI003EBB235F